VSADARISRLRQALWGADRVTPIKIEFRHIETSNESALRTPDEIEFLNNQGRQEARNRQWQRWLFANPVTRKPYHQEEIQKRHIRKAGIAAKIGGDIGLAYVSAQLPVLAG
jgi:hypothetical protein